MTHEFRSFWYGDEISPLEYLSIQSFLAHGHSYVLYTYAPVADLPSGCGLADARTVLPEEEVFFYKGAHAGSPAGFANLFRYTLLRDHGGWWVDTDTLCCRSDLRDSEYVFAKQDSKLWANGVLRAPIGSGLMALATERARGRGVDFKWGTTGPVLLTALIHELGLEELSWATSDLYPWNWREALAVIDQAQTARLEELTSNCTFAHFYSEMFRTYDIAKTRRPPKGTFLDFLYDVYDVPISSERRYTEAEVAAKLAMERRRNSPLASALAKARAALRGMRRGVASGSRV